MKKITFIGIICLIFTVTGQAKEKKSASTVCVSSSQDGFNSFLTAALISQHVNVVIIPCEKAEFTLSNTSMQEGQSVSSRGVGGVIGGIVGARGHRREETEAAISVIRNSDQEIVFAASSDRGEMKKVAEKTAKQLKAYFK